jgi:hypothetical protein
MEQALIGFTGAPWTVATYMVEGHGGTDFAQLKAWAWRDPEGFQQLIDRLVVATAEYLMAQVEVVGELSPDPSHQQDDCSSRARAQGGVLRQMGSKSTQTRTRIRPIGTMGSRIRSMPRVGLEAAVEKWRARE